MNFGREKNLIIWKKWLADQNPAAAAGAAASAAAAGGAAAGGSGSKYLDD